MRLFATLDDFGQVLGGVKKWDRTLEAIDCIDTVLPGVAYSVGDSLTWIKCQKQSCADDSLVASRRYQRVVYCSQGTVTIGYGTIDALTAVDDYSDLTDRQHFQGETHTISLSPGNIVIFETEEATALEPSDDFQGVILRVTVEGHSFHNK
ncbi:MAG: YhcH/YjgK/YiaL family protein [Actinomycetaceae bacterium]|nr:YhcH/YjgK/YiaL family protein [Actinomycetaceae bacterium]